MRMPVVVDSFLSFYYISFGDAIPFSVVEPLTLLGLAYISYLLAEVIHFSGHIW
jgi:hypothetical protein